MRVEQEDAHVRPYLQHFLKNCHDAARLPHSCGPQHRKMSGHHLVDVYIGRQRLILLQLADADRLIPLFPVNDTQLIAADCHHWIADVRILGNSTQKPPRSASFGPDFAHEVETGRGRVTLVSDNLRYFYGNLGDKTDQDRPFAHNGQEISDCRAFDAR
jgi:hypothetical protein